MASTGVFGRDMHSPGYQDAHCLPSAGLKPPLDRDVYRFNRVVPMFESDPCIRPNEGVLLCPPGCGQEKRNDLMPYAGVMPRGDVFRFYTARQTAPKPTPMGACRCPAFANDPPCTSMGPITDPLQCPCINRMNLGQGQYHTQTQHMHHTDPSVPSQAAANHENKHFVQNGRVHSTYDMRQGAVAPTPATMMAAGGIKNNMAIFGKADYQCQNPYYPSNYICRPVYDRKYLDDCPEQNGPPADVYTFL